MKSITQTAAQRHLYRLLRELPKTGPVVVTARKKGNVAALIPVPGVFALADVAEIDTKEALLAAMGESDVETE